MRLLLLAFCLVAALATAAAAQEPAHVHVEPASPQAPKPSRPTDASAWQWGTEGVAFLGYNYQRREFTDFAEWESQNWLMTTGAGTFGASRVRLTGMLSFEPFTLQDIGSPQVFQTGETFNGAPLIDYQHPHDLIMNLGGDFTRRFNETRLTVAGYIVGPAPIGPPVFMHRPSAAENPQAPLGHHYLDSTHITPGVVSIGIEHRGWMLEGGVFQGREPDEDRLDLDLGALDSYSGRLSWRRGPWSAQVSAASLTTPERTSPYDANRITASLAYHRADSQQSVAWLAAFGQNREFYGNLEAYLFELTKRAGRHAFYTRAESVAKDILDAGFHPIGTAHAHRQSQVSALTLGYAHDLVPATTRWGSLALGADLTGYLVPANLKASYGSPVSFHGFVRYRGRAGQPATHVH
jgi:hypothetical protein